MPAPGQPIAVHPALKAGKRTKPLPAGMQSLPLKDAKLVGGTPPKTSPTKASPVSTCRSDIVQYTPRGTNVIKPSGINRSGGAGAIDSHEAAEIMTHVRGKLSAHYDEKELVTNPIAIKVGKSTDSMDAIYVRQALDMYFKFDYMENNVNGLLFDPLRPED